MSDEKKPQPVPKPAERSIGERYYEIQERRMDEAIEEAAARYKARKKAKAAHSPD